MSSQAGVTPVQIALVFRLAWVVFKTRNVVSIVAPVIAHALV